jgi:hypothetical protein
MQDILKDLGISTEAEKVETLKEQVFEVFETPSTIFCPLTDELIKDGFYTISNSNGKIHGKVSSKDSLLPLDQLIDIAYSVNIDLDLGLQFDRAVIEYFANESIAQLKIPMGKSAFKTRNGFDDGSDVFLFIKTGFGGVCRTEVGIYTYRWACTNGLVVRHGLQYFQAKHTEKMNERVKIFLSEVLPNMTKSVFEYTKMASRFDAKDVTDEQIEAFRQKFFNYKKDDELSTKKLNMIDAFNQSMREEMERVGQTVWGLLQSATNFTNHKHYSKSREFHIVGAGANQNAVAEKYCLDLVETK